MNVSLGEETQVRRLRTGLSSDYCYDYAFIILMLLHLPLLNLTMPVNIDCDKKRAHGARSTRPWRSGSLAAHWTWTVEPSEKLIVSTHLLPFGWNTVKGGGSSGCGGGGLSSTGREASRWRAQRVVASSTLIADLLAYLLTYFLTYLRTYLITCLLTNSVTLVLTDACPPLRLLKWLSHHSSRSAVPL